MSKDKDWVEFGTPECIALELAHMKFGVPVDVREAGTNNAWAHRNNYWKASPFSAVWDYRISKT
jgi:hypothetical protein